MRRGRPVVAIRDVVRLHVDDDLVAAQCLVGHGAIAHRVVGHHVELRPELLVDREQAGRGALPVEPEAVLVGDRGVLGELVRVHPSAGDLLRGGPGGELVCVQRLQERRNVAPHSHQRFASSCLEHPGGAVGRR